MIRPLFALAIVFLLGSSANLFAQDSSEKKSQESQPPHFEPIESRWFIKPLPYEVNEPGEWWNPYRQNILKGDFPIFGQDIFLSITGQEKLLYEMRRLPTPSGSTGHFSVPRDFFGEGEQSVLVSNTSISFDLFKGQQAFKPVDWRLKATLVYNVTDVTLQQVGAVNVSPSDGRNRTTHDIALQEGFAEVHLMDLSDRYDFISSETGILPFRSDFRGFIFDDTNLGARLFGNADENKWQYNLVFFNMLEKSTNSELNTLNQRNQQILIANLYRQDWPVEGYTTSVSFHYNHDEAGVHFDENGFLNRPAPAGAAAQHELDVYYLGWAGEGHLGRFNITHAFYEALGHDTNNPFAARSVGIEAQMAALELSYDFDWLRVRGYGLYSSGDKDTRDHEANGFDTINGSPNFAGGEFSYWNRQAIKLLGVNLNQRLSPFPNLSTSKFEGQSNFVNPGLLMVGGAMDAELTPTWRGQLGMNYLRFMNTSSLQTYLELEDIQKGIGTEIFMGTQYRPLLTNNLILKVGAAGLFPDNGFQKIYETNKLQYSVFSELVLTW